MGRAISEKGQEAAQEVVGVGADQREKPISINRLNGPAGDRVVLWPSL